MKKQILLSALLAATLVAQAGVEPKVKPEALVSGHQYVLVNQAMSANQYMSRTSWDGALYFLPEADSKYATHAFTAQQNENGTWSFTIPGVETVETGEFDDDGNPITEEKPITLYMAFPDGSSNVNFRATEPVEWGVDLRENNYYQLILGKGNNSDALAQGIYTPTGDIRMHLNNGCQFFVTSYPGNQYYPDCFGGINEIYDEDTGDLQFEANDSISFYWGFVSVERIPAYMADMQVVKLINDFAENYCDLDEYDKGFQLTLEAAVAFYESDEFNEDEAQTLTDMLNNKIELYQEIENAILLNEEDDDVLNAAIANAMDIFTTTTDAATLLAATETLKQAEVDYSMGTGDVTSLGKNMSFEDLRAQNGAGTSSVAAPPYGWNIYINGQQVTTADEVSAAGITAWHGVNDDCDGDIKDGLYGFGIWNGSIPSYEISQTIDGLENGTYIITAGLMVGANGNGSRRTTQRIFGNLNSTYFAMENEYDLSLLDKSEVYDFAGLTELTTDRTLQPVEVRAFVYDGTLTFGVRTDNNIAAANRQSSNGAGGDGWFKTDNFKIQKVGYVPADAIAVYDFYCNILQEINANGDPMAEAVATELEAAVDKMGSLTEETPLDEMVSAILAARELVATVDASVKTYQRLGNAIEEHYQYLEQYGEKMGANDYLDVIMEAEDAYQNGTAADEAAVDSIIAVLNAALQACIQSDEIEPGMNLTDYIQNPSFEDYSTQGSGSSGGVENTPKGWNLYVNGAQCVTAAETREAGITGWCAINNGDNINVELEDGTVVTHQYSDGDHLWGIWNGTIPEIELSQTLQNMPAGTYTLTCDVLVQYNWAGYCITTQRIFANDYVAMYSFEGNYANNMPADAQDAIAIDNLVEGIEVPHLIYGGYQCESPRSDYSHTVSLTFGLAEKGDILIGFRTNNIDRDGIAQGNGKGWFKLDNWTLTYVSDEVPAGAELHPVKVITVEDITALIDQYLDGVEGITVTTITNLIDQYLAQ